LCYYIRFPKQLTLIDATTPNLVQIYMCPYNDNSLYTDGVVFVGDTLFAGSIGRTDFPGGNFDTLISSIKTKLFKMDDNVKVLSGHGPETSIGREKRYNPFVGQV
jgi:glyoxylase-like metal-dependent hydrolase (beta-lactamase superfamily II)